MNLITSIQKYSIHDGDGIRTTVFFKGCPLSCTWCHNPETQQYHKQLLVNTERCVGCGNCITSCPSQAISIIDAKASTQFNLCQGCGECVDACNLNLRELVGKAYTADELFKELKKDEMFYEQSGGGVTLSGGEVMTMDIDYLEALCKKLKRYGITVTIDTCGHAPFVNFQRLLPYVDTFLYDIKTTDNTIHQTYMGVTNERILSNLIELSRNGAKIYIRIPVIKEVNGSDENLSATIQFLQENNIHVSQVNLLPYHNTGSAKYSRLGIEYQGTSFTAPSNEEMEHFVTLFKSAGFSNVKIGG